MKTKSPDEKFIFRGQNPVQNPEIDGILAPWVADSSEALSVQYSDARVGGSCLEAKNTADTYGRVHSSAIADAVPVTPGETVHVRGSMKAVSVSTGAFKFVRLTVEFYDSEGERIGTSTLIETSGAEPVLGEWYDFEGTAEAPEGAVGMLVSPETETTASATFIWRVDRVAVARPLDTNDQVDWTMEAMTFVPAEKKSQLAENPNADGVVLVEEAHYGPAYFNLTLRALGAEDTDSALEAIGELMNKLQGCERIRGGGPCEWTPNNASTTYTAYVLFAEIEELPITVDGELAGWFLEMPVIKVKLTCRPFLYTEARRVLAPVESEDPVQVVYVGGILGHVPAEARLQLADAASQTRRYVAWGRDVVNSEEGNPQLNFEAGELTIEGLAGELAEKEGSVSAEVIKATLVDTPVVICSTGEIAHAGSFRGQVRAATATGGAAMLRVSYRVGDGSEKALNWQPVGADGWYEIDLREIFLEQAERGEQVSEVLIEGKSEEGGEVFIDLFDLMPTRAYGVARGPADILTPSSLDGLDRFNHSTGNLAGKTSEIGGGWAGAGDGGDFTVNTSSQAQRTTLADASNVPRYETLGANEYTGIFAKAAVRSTNPLEENAQFGLLLRYVNTNNWLRLVLVKAGVSGSGGHQINNWFAYFQKRVAGTVSSFYGPNGFSSALGPNDGYSAIVSAEKNTTIDWVTLEALILADGTFAVGAEGETYLTGVDSDLATGGALAEGKIGLVDEKTGSSSETRYFDDFTAWVPSIGFVCNADRAIEVTPDRVERQDAGGTFWSPVPLYRGSGFYLDPAGDDGLVNRIAAKMRRSDVKQEASTSPADPQTLGIVVKERFLTPQ